jgi:acyl carrier protein
LQLTWFRRFAAEPMRFKAVQIPQTGGHHGSRYFTLDARDTFANHSAAGVLPVASDQKRISRMVLAKSAEMGELTGEDAGILDRLLQIIANEGLVDRAKLEPHANLEEIGVSADDLILIGNAIEREFDRDVLGDEELEKCVTVRELLKLVVDRITAPDASVAAVASAPPGNDPRE